MKKFEDLYNEISVNNELKETWRQAREEAKRINRITISASILITATLLILITKLERFSLITLMPLLFIIIFVNTVIYIISMFFRKKQKRYKDVFKKVVIEKLIENFYNSLEYFPNKEMPERIYDEADYDEDYDEYYSDDYIEAKINNKYDIEMAEVITQHVETKEDSDGNSHTTTTTKFHGIFVKIVIDKSINSKLEIKQDGSNRFSKERLEMDSSEFEKYFDVSATNKIIGMQLLTADVMEELIDFENKTNMKYDVVINNNNIYLRFHCGPMFEPQSLKKGVVDEKNLQKNFYMLNFIYNLSDKIIKLIHETEI